MGIYVPPVDLRNLRPAREGPRPGGDITWAATAAVGVTTVAMALVLGDGREFMAAAACIAFGVVFAIRPAYGVYAIVIARPSDALARSSIHGLTRFQSYVAMKIASASGTMTRIATTTIKTRRTRGRMRRSVRWRRDRV